MAHVQIHAKPATRIGNMVSKSPQVATWENQEFSFAIDGVDITQSIVGGDTGIIVEIPPGFPHEAPTVTFSVFADVLDLDVPESLLDAVMTKAGA